MNKADRLVCRVQNREPTVPLWMQGTGRRTHRPIIDAGFALCSCNSFFAACEKNKNVINGMERPAEIITDLGYNMYAVFLKCKSLCPGVMHLLVYTEQVIRPSFAVCTCMAEEYLSM